MRWDRWGSDDSRCGTTPQCATVAQTQLTPVATNASQTYIARLGFQDPDRRQDRHGLACEYLYERIIELEIRPVAANTENFDIQELASEALLRFKPAECINVPIKSQSYKSSYINGFADVLLGHTHGYHRQFLGEVKITKEPAEQVLQQINFYLEYIEHVECVYIVTDYDPGDLKRLCVGTKIKVYRLGQVFEQWLANRTTPETEEL